MSLVPRLGKISTKSSAFFLCDVQEKFRQLIKFFPEICEVGARLTAASRILDVPLVATEHYPKGLGSIVSEIDITNASKFSKTSFSMLTPEVEEHMNKNLPDVKSVVLFGIEAQMCVQQTALDLLERNYEVHVIADASSSRTLADRNIAFERMKQSGALITTCDSILFMLLQDAKHKNFHEIQKLIMNPPPYQALALEN